VQALYRDQLALLDQLSARNKGQLSASLAARRQAARRVAEYGTQDRLAVSEERERSEGGSNQESGGSKCDACSKKRLDFSYINQ
jgi:hypothetical protein